MCVCVCMCERESKGGGKSDVKGVSNKLMAQGIHCMSTLL